VPDQATLVAATNLFGDVVYGGQLAANSYSIHDLHINGSLDAGRPCVTGQGANLRADGNSYTLYNVESIASPCANWQVAGDSFHIYSNYLWHSGIPAPQGGPVGDGLGVFAGSGGQIDHNTIADATDIALVIGGGSRWIHDNLIQSINSYGLTGLNVGNFDNNGHHEGGIYESNSSVGIQHACNRNASWRSPVETDPAYNVWNAGTVRNNSVSGAVNIVVDGIAGYKG
jgi:hypothetical protein